MEKKGLGRGLSSLLGVLDEKDDEIVTLSPKERKEEFKKLGVEEIEIGLIREFVSKVQQTRKDMGFEVVDHINIYVNASNETNEILNKYSKDICSGTLADSLETKEVSGMQDIELNSESVKLKVEKV